MIYLILVLALVLRLISINQSLWLDEAIGALSARDLSYNELIQSFVAIDNHPPLYYLLLKAWTGLFGYSELALRAPSVIFSITTIYLVFLIGRKIFKEKLTPYIASIFIATSQFHIYFSQEARMYSMAAFFATLSIYSFLYLLETNADKKYWFMFSVANLVLIATDYMPVFLFPVFVISGIWKRCDSGWWKKVFISFIPTLIFLVFWSPIFLRQINGYRWLVIDEGLGGFINGGANFKELALVWMKFTLGRVNHFNKNMYYVISILASVPFVLLIVKAFGVFQKHRLIFLSFFVPLVFGFAVSFIFPAFVYFRFLYIYPAFILILGMGYENTEKYSVRYLAAIFVFLINLISWIYYIKTPSQQREQWSGAVGFVEQKVRADEVILFSFPDPYAPYRWYEKFPEKSFGSTDSIRATKEDTIKLTQTYLEGKNGVYYFEYLREVSDPESVVGTTILESGFENVSAFGQFNGVGHIYYFKK